jgi:hypothetical protein
VNYLRFLASLLWLGIGSSEGLYLHGTQEQKKNGHASTPQLTFEQTIPVFKRLKPPHILDSAATVIRHIKLNIKIHL